MSGPVTKEGLIQLEDSIRRLDDTIKSLPKEERLAQYKDFVLGIATALVEMTAEQRKEYKLTLELIAAAKKLEKVGVEHGVYFSFSGIPHLAITADPVQEKSGGEKKEEKKEKKKSSVLDVLREK